MTDRLKTLVLLTLTACALFRVGGSRPGHSQTPVQGNNPLSDWRPSHDPAGIRFVGSKRCAQCHKDKASTQFDTPMAHALELIADCQLLTKRPRLTFNNGSYTYRIVRQGNGSTYNVTSGAGTVSEPILYCFGQGKGGQTYVFRHNGVLYEGRVSYYQAIQSLDFTLGHSHMVPSSLEESMGRPLSKGEALDCFGCHAPAAIVGSELQLDGLIPGVTCEACHGPGEKHIAAVSSRASKETRIFNPGKMDPISLSQEFCGACHRGFDQVMVMPGQAGVNNIRFQPYRIFNSPGHNKLDSRISCLACHDPHSKVEHDAAFYDSKCLACHLSSPQDARSDSRMAGACSVGTKQCASCHMPKLEIPETHTKFTDHWIRIVRPNERVPR